VRSLTGSPLERAASNVDAAEAHLLRVAPERYLRGHLPSLLAQVRRHLAADDPRRERFEAIAARAGLPGELERQRDALVGAVRGASSAARREVVQVRSFRNVLVVAATLLAFAAGGLALVGVLNRNAIALCFNPTGAGQQGRVVCPTKERTVGSEPATGGAGGGGASTGTQAGDVDATTKMTTTAWDVPLIELVGLIAAAVAAAASLRRVQGTTTPYSLPVALALLKLPTGALTAVLGLLLMRGGFVPGLSALDTSGQIVSWAVIFGYAQEIFTLFVDRQANSVLNRVGRTVPQRRVSDGR
jgi:hypothetical protein